MKICVIGLTTMAGAMTRHILMQLSVILISLEVKLIQLRCHSTSLLNYYSYLWKNKHLQKETPLYFF